MAGDYGKVHRLMRMVVLMQQGKAGNAAHLAQTLGVAERTIFRDIRVLEDLGIPCYLDSELGYRIRSDFFLPPIHLTAGEALALLALRPVGQNDQMELTGSAAAAMEKIRGQLPAKVIDELGDLDDHIDVQLPPSGPSAKAIVEAFNVVKTALRSRTALRCQYDSLRNDADGNEYFDFHPYVLTFDQRAWYAVGFHMGRGEVRRLKLTRFNSLVPTETPYCIPDDFSLAAHRGQAWRMMRGEKLYHIVVEFSAIVAETVADTNWHPSQNTDEHEDGSMTFTCDVEGLDEIVWWILSYGPHARVIEPPELAERTRDLAQQAADLYA